VRLAGSPASLLALGRNRHHWQVFVTEARAVSIAVLFLVGESDPIAGVEDTYEVSSHVRNTRTVVLAGIGHAAHIEAPAEVARAIHGFWDE
jgi:pimeloyl-ACP methyl ester carboxylesterase